MHLGISPIILIWALNAYFPDAISHVICKDFMQCRLVDLSANNTKSAEVISTFVFVVVAIITFTIKIR